MEVEGLYETFVYHQLRCFTRLLHVSSLEVFPDLEGLLRNLSDFSKGWGKCQSKNDFVVEKVVIVGDFVKSVCFVIEVFGTSTLD